VLARLLRRMDVMPLSVSSTAALNNSPYQTTFPAAPKQRTEPKPRRKPVRVVGLYLEREPDPLRHARALLVLIQVECPEKVGSFIPRSHLDRAYRELCVHEGWKALGWTAIARALGTLTCKRLLKRNGVRFVAYRLPAPNCPRIAPNRAPKLLCGR
jgi:hypothetical protein